MKRTVSLASLALVITALSFAAAGCASHERPPEMQAAAPGGAYPLTKCVVSGEDLGEKPYVFVHDGQTVKLCCKDCLAKFNEDPAKYIAKITQAK